jgi:hypothetical protein
MDFAGLAQRATGWVRGAMLYQNDECIRCKQPAWQLGSRAGEQVFLVGAHRFTATISCTHSRPGDEFGPIRRGAAPRNDAWPSSVGRADAQGRARMAQRPILGILARSPDARDGATNPGYASAEIIRCRTALKRRKYRRAHLIYLNALLRIPPARLSGWPREYPTDTRPPARRRSAVPCARSTGRCAGSRPSSP